MKINTDMTEESLIQDLQSLSISAENFLSNQSDISAQNVSETELSHPEGITATQHALLPEHPHTSSISSGQGLLPDEGPYDQSFSSIHNNFPAELPCNNAVPSAFNAASSSGEMETLDLGAGSAESSAHGETRKNKKPIILVLGESQRARISTIQTAAGPVFYLPASEEAAQSPIPPIPESVLNELYEARNRLLQDKDFPGKVMMCQKFLQQTMRANSSFNSN